MSDEATTVAASPPAPSTAGAQYPYDVFISYSHKDAAWVRDEFLPQLRDADLKVLIDTEFEVGVPSVQNMTNAIRDARHVVIVLTPNWVASEWTAFEGYLFTTSDPVGKRRRVLPLMLEPCKPPPHIAFLTYADFTQPARRAEELQRLFRAMKAHDNLQEALPIHTSFATEYARAGLQALADLMQHADVRETVGGWRAIFRETRQQAEKLFNYKDLHDRLHDIQIRCYNQLVQEMPRFPDDRVARVALESSKDLLEDRIEKIREIIGRAAYLAPEKNDLKSLELALATFTEALAKRDRALLRTSERKLNRVLALQPSRINASLVTTAGNLDLLELVDAMEKILKRLSDLKADPAKLQQFKDGTTALAALHEALSTLIEEHNLWQQVDNRFTRIGSEVVTDPESLFESWNDVHAIAAPLYEKRLDAWAEKYRALEQRLLKAIAERLPEDTQDNFLLCRSLAVERFYQVDVDLKKCCENLSKISEPLAAVLESL